MKKQLTVLLIVLSNLNIFSQSESKKLNQLFLELDKTQGINKAIVYNKLGDFASDVSDYAQALNYHNKALKMFTKFKDEQGERNTLLCISSDYSKMGYFDKAHKYVLLLLDKAESKNDYRNLAGAYNNKALIELNSNKDATQSLRKAYYYAKKIDDTLFIKTATINNLALFYFNTNKLDSSRLFFLKALDLSIKTKNQYSVAGVYLNIANLLLEEKKYANAFDTTRLALTIAISNNFMDIQLPAMNLLFKTHEAKGNNDSALYYLKKCLPLQDSLTQRKNNENIRNAEIRTALLSKEHENMILHKNNKIKSLQIDSQRSWLYILPIGILMILVFTVILFYLFQKQRKSNNALVKRNLEILESEIQLRSINDKLLLNLNNDFLPEKKSATSSVDLAQKKEIIENLHHALEIKKIFTQNNLSLNSLATELNTNRTYLSQIIREHYHTGFNELVNNYRVSEARRLLADENNLHFTVEHIGNLSGFSSRATFYSVFKQLTGVTPSFFQKSVSHLRMDKPSFEE